MKPTLFLLAAGMGSRYGGLKQLDGLGPNGETIMDYSIYDAINAGFGKLVFVIRKDFEQDFRDKIISKYEGHIPCELVFQSIDDLPEGFTCPADRTKPWGTNHAEEWVLFEKNIGPYVGIDEVSLSQGRCSFRRAPILPHGTAGSSSCNRSDDCGTDAQEVHRSPRREGLEACFLRNGWRRMCRWRCPQSGRWPTGTG